MRVNGPEEPAGEGTDLTARARSRALRLLARREKSRRGLTHSLRRAGFPSAVVRTVVEDLERGGLIDDRRFCRLYLGEQARLRPRSLRLMTRDLRREGIDPGMVEEVCADLGEELEESALARSAARRKLRVAGADPERLARLLAARGFGRPLVVEILRELDVEGAGILKSRAPETDTEGTGFEEEQDDSP